jgi:hypothetical protein
VLFLSLTDTDSLESLSKIGLAEEAIPTEEMRPVVAWAIERFFESGRTRAPSRVALLDTWGQQIEDAKVELLPEDEDADTIQWAIDMLKAQYIHFQHNLFIRKAANDMAAATNPDKILALAQQSDTLFALSMKVQPRHMQVEISQGVVNSLAAYEAREREGSITKGMVFGLPIIDQHTYGIHEGEVAVLAAGPKVGKSYGVGWFAKECWMAGQDAVIFTLENSVEMTTDRIVCMILMINSRDWQRGLCTQAEKDAVAEFINVTIPSMPAKLHIIMPEPGKRTMASMVRMTQMLGCRRMFIDQLTFVEHPDPGRKPRNEIIRDQMHELKTMISTGSEPIACLIAHQINRAGIESARKCGYLLMEHMAEGSEVERTADWVFGLYQSNDARVYGKVLFQILASRREKLMAWELIWQPYAGLMSVKKEIDINTLKQVEDPNVPVKVAVAS